MALIKIDAASVSHGCSECGRPFSEKAAVRIAANKEGTPCCKKETVKLSGKALDDAKLKTAGLFENYV